jgi:hypothetical protein
MLLYNNVAQLRQFYGFGAFAAHGFVFCSRHAVAAPDKRLILQSFAKTHRGVANACRRAFGLMRRGASLWEVTAITGGFRLRPPGRPEKDQLLER